MHSELDPQLMFNILLTNNFPKNNLRFSSKSNTYIILQSKSDIAMR